MSKYDRSDCKSLNNLTKMLNMLVKESNNKKSPRRSPRSRTDSSASFTPLAKRSCTKEKCKKESELSNKTLDAWLVKKELVPSCSSKNLEKQSKKESLKKTSHLLNKSKSQSPKESPKLPQKGKCTTKGIKKSPNITQKTSKEGNSKKIVTKSLKMSPSKQANLKSFVTKSSTKKTIFKRNDSSESCELPTFTKSTKTKHLTTTKKEQKALFKKYGVVFPTVDEVLKDKEEHEKVKSSLESFNPMNDDSLEFQPFSEQELKEKENIIDCKNLTPKQLLKMFKKNVQYLSDIFYEKIKNDRHKRYFDKNVRVLTNSVKDLTYSTSTIVFSYEQKIYLLELLKEKFDPDDTKTKYFFQVLLPELCLKIFMETYQMDCDEAVKYLEEHPVKD